MNCMNLLEIIGSYNALPASAVQACTEFFSSSFFTNVHVINSIFWLRSLKCRRSLSIPKDSGFCSPHVHFNQILWTIKAAALEQSIVWKTEGRYITGRFIRMQKKFIKILLCVRTAINQTLLPLVAMPLFWENHLSRFH